MEREEKHPQFKSVEELMEYVDRQAQRRIKQISDEYRKIAEIEPYDQVILKVLKQAKKPLSVDLISFLTGLSKSRCCKILKRLEEKWKLVTKVTVAKVSFYAITPGDRLKTDVNRVVR